MPRQQEAKLRNNNDSSVIFTLILVPMLFFQKLFIPPIGQQEKPRALIISYNVSLQKKESTSKSKITIMFYCMYPFLAFYRDGSVSGHTFFHKSNFYQRRAIRSSRFERIDRLNSSDSHQITVPISSITNHPRLHILVN